MSARIYLFPFGQPAERAVDPEQTIDTALRTFLAVEDALAGQWSDSVLISLLATADPLDRGAVIRELEARSARRIFQPEPKD